VKKERPLRRTCHCLLLCFLSSSALADLPAPAPDQQVVFSRSRAFRLEIVTGQSDGRTPPRAPTASGTTTSYENGAKVTTRATFEKGQLKAVALETKRGEPPQALLRLSKGTSVVWEVELDWLPGSAVVADSGQWVATFDHWGNSGQNPHVVVLFDDKGRMTKALTLNDLFTSSEQDQLTRSTRSIWWAAGMYEEGVPHAFSADEKQLVLKVQLAGHARPNLEQPPATERRIELATGKVLR
jgi:hypothetical protein